MGEAPAWYRVIKASQYLGMSPPEVAAMPLFWVKAAEQAQQAEAIASAEQAKLKTTSRH